MRRLRFVLFFYGYQHNKKPLAGCEWHPVRGSLVYYVYHVYNRSTDPIAPQREEILERIGRQLGNPAFGAGNDIVA